MKNALYLLTALILGTFSCKKEEPQDATPIVIHDIVGTVNLYDEGLKEVSNSGMKVTLLEANSAIFDFTDEEGKYYLTEVPTGEYTLLFEKEGYGTFKMFNVKHEATETTFISPSPSLGEKTTTSISQVVAHYAQDSLTITTTLYQDASLSNPKFIRVFWGDSNLSVTNYQVVDTAVVVRINPIKLKFSKAELLEKGLIMGVPIQVSISGESFWGNDYFDPNLGYRVFPNLNWSDANDTFTIL